MTNAYTLLTSKEDISICAFYKAIMKVFYFQLAELEDDFFTLNEGGDLSKKNVTNKKNFVIKCLEVDSAWR